MVESGGCLSSILPFGDYGDFGGLHGWMVLRLFCLAGRANASFCAVTTETEGVTGLVGVVIDGVIGGCCS